LGLITDEDPPGSGSHPVQDDGRRLRREEPPVPEFVPDPRGRPAQVVGGEVFGQQAHPDEDGPRYLLPDSI
jgi:hypothetical protein